MKTVTSALILIHLLLVAGCSTLKKAPDIATPTEKTESSSASSTEIFGPPAGQAESLSAAEPIQIHPIVLVLGPGLARGFAYSGVIAALNELKIPIAAVFGTEMGALIGALYVTSSNLNQFEWKLLKFKEEVFQQEQGFLARLKNKVLPEGKKLEARLAEVFGNRTIQESDIPFRVAVQSKSLGIPLVLDQGKLSEVIRGALAVPGILSPITINLVTGTQTENLEVMSAGTTRPFLVNEARRVGLGPVVVIDVLTEAESRGAVEELKQADLVIKPNLAGIEYTDFNKKTDAAFQGKLAVTQVLQDLQRVMSSFNNENRSRQ